VEQWIEHAKSLSEPIPGDNPCGDDPRYSDQFSELKAEIEKKSDVDFELIQELATSILVESSKDLRVVSYLLLALARLEGFNGLAKGMVVLNQLIAAFGEQLHPIKPKARHSAVKWFQQDKVLTFARNATDKVELNEANYAIEIYNQLFDQLTSLCGEPLSWPDLQKWLKTTQESVKPVEAPKPKATPEPTHSNTGSATPQIPSPVPMGSSGIASTKEYTQALRQLVQYFREQKLYSKMFGMACTCQWGNLKLPPNEQGKTRLPAPRETSLARIRNALDNEQWEEGLLACLDAFLEPSGQFSFDIIKWAYDCAKNTHEKELMLTLQMHAVLITQRLPKIAQLKFENEEAFMSSVAMAWLETISQANTSNSSADSSTGIHELLQESRNILQAESIQKAFQYLDEQPTNNQLKKTMIEFCKAQLCVEQDRSDLAFPMLLQLEGKVDELSLDQVSPEFAMQIWRQLHRVLSDQLSENEQEQDRADMENHLSRLQSKMCTTDVASAMQWL
jgi:type VI secretion system protein VasJ